MIKIDLLVPDEDNELVLVEDAKADETTIEELAESQLSDSSEGNDEAITDNDPENEEIDPAIVSELEEYKQSGIDKEPELTENDDDKLESEGLAEEYVSDESSGSQSEQAKKSRKILITIIILIALGVGTYVSWIKNYIPLEYKTKISELISPYLGEEPVTQIPKELVPEEEIDILMKSVQDTVKEEKTPVAIEESESEDASDYEKEDELVEKVSTEKEEPVTIFKDYQRLLDETRNSKTKVYFTSNLLKLFPKGLYISYYSLGSNTLTLETKSSDPEKYKVFNSRLNKNKLFKKLDHFTYDDDISNSKIGVFKGEIRSVFIKQAEDLYDLSSDNYIDYLADIAGSLKMNFTELYRNEIPSNIKNVKATTLQLGFYGDISKIRQFLEESASIPATYSISKIFISRGAVDSFPIPLKLNVYLTLYERAE